VKIRRIRTVLALATLGLFASRAIAQPAPPPDAPADRAPADTAPVSTSDATAPPASAPPAAPPAAAPPPAPPPTVTPYPPAATTPAPAYAYPQAYPYGPAPGYAPTAPAPQPEKRDPRVADANADRVVLLPTAYTHPKGTVYLSSNEIILLQLGYALSDSTQVTFTGTPPIGDPDKVFVLDLSLKSAFVRDGPLRLAAIGSVSGIFGEIDQGNLVLGRVGAVAQLCADEACESSASISSNVLLAGPATFMLAGAGGIWRVANWAALLLEVDTFVPLGNQIAQYSGVAVVPGFRFPYKNWALDLAVARALDTKDPPDPAVIPWIAFTYRFLP
jgi:hypothetical protein